MPTQFVPGPGDSGLSPFERALRSSGTAMGLFQSFENHRTQNQLAKTQMAATLADIAMKQQLLSGRIDLQNSRARLEGAHADTLGFELRRTENQYNQFGPLLDSLAVDRQVLQMNQMEQGLGVGETELDHRRFINKVMKDTYTEAEAEYDKMIDEEKNPEKKRFLIGAKSPFIQERLNAVNQMARATVDLNNQNKIIDSQLATAEEGRQSASLARTMQIAQTAMSSEVGFETMRSAFPDNPMLKTIGEYRDKHPNMKLFEDPKQTLLDIADGLRESDPESAGMFMFMALGGDPRMVMGQATARMMDESGGQYEVSKPTGQRGLFSALGRARVSKDGKSITIPVDETPTNKSLNGPRPTTQPSVSAGKQNQPIRIPQSAKKYVGSSVWTLVE